MTEKQPSDLYAAKQKIIFDQAGEIKKLKKQLQEALEEIKRLKKAKK